MVAAIALVYGNSVGAPFLFDDAGAVLHNPTLRARNPLVWLSPPADGSTTTGRPLVNVTYALNFAVSGQNVWSYHAVNIALHAAAALALMGIVRRTLKSPRLGGHFGAWSQSLAFFVALLWALHPLQTETVVSIAQRTELLCGLFYLFTLYAFIRGSESPSRRWLMVSVVACLAGMATKEVMISAPVIVLLYDRTFMAGSFSAAWHGRKKYYLALAGTWLLLAALLWQTGAARGASAGFGLGVSSWSYLLKQCEALPLYLKLSFWPHPLVVDYGTDVLESVAGVWARGLLVLLLLAGSIWALRRRPVPGFAGAWLFLILAPSSSFVPLVTQTMAEHRMYLPLAVIMGVVALLAYRAADARAAWLLAAASLALGGVTFARNRDYLDPVRLWTANVAHHPTGARGHNNLAVALQARGHSAAANRHFERAISLQPAYVTAYYNWGVALLEQQRIPEAIARLETAIRIAPDHADAQVNLGQALFQAGRTADAIGHFEIALQLQPAADAHFNLGIARATVGDSRAALVHLSAALQLKPDFTSAAFALGNLLAREQKYIEAAAAFRHTLRFDPGHFAALANLGNALLASGQPAEAITLYEAALRARPDDQRLRENLALAHEASTLPPITAPSVSK